VKKDTPKSLKYKVGDKVFVTLEGANEVSFRANISEVYTIKSIDLMGIGVSQVRFVETGQICHLNGIVPATELMKALL
jgi:hypothetical protein